MKRKLKLALFSSVTAMPLLFMAASCGKTSKFSEKKYEENILKQLGVGSESNSKWSEENFIPLSSNVSNFLAKDKTYIVYSISEHKKPNAFFFDNSNSYGSFLGRPSENTGALLVRVETKLRPIVVDAEGFKILRPSIWRYKLEYASKVVVTLNDGTVKEFDNDNIDVYPEASGKVNFAGKEVEYYNKIQYKAGSTDERSINSDNFSKALKDAKKVQLVIRKGQKWQKLNGELTNYDVNADDFYVSWLRTALLNQSDRQAYLEKGGLTHDEAQTLDENASSLLEDGSKYFTENMEYPNEYLYSLYNVNSSDFYDRAKFITKVGDDDAITFNIAKEGEKTYFEDVFADLASGMTFVAAPSQYIKEKVSNFTIEPFQSDKENELASLKSLVAKLPDDNLVKLAGVYWYGINYQDMLFAGRYLYDGYNDGTQTETYIKNDKYFDANSTSTNTYKLRYGNNIDASRFKANTYNDYQRGAISTMNVDNLNQKDRASAERKRFELGSFYTRQFNKQDSMFEMVQTIIPRWQLWTLKEKDKSFNYNDVYSRLMFGMGLEELKAGAAKGADTFEKLFAGTGVRFRTLVNAAINWEQVANIVSSGTSKSWISGYAQDGLIGARDSRDLTPFDKYEDISKLFAVSSTFDKLVFKASNTGTNPVTEITPSLNSELLPDLQDDNEKIKSFGFNAIQEEVTKLLDTLYAENNLEETQKVKWTVPWRYLSFNPVSYQSVFTEILPQLIKSLDKKGRLEPEFRLFTDRPSLAGNLSKPTTAYQWTGWGYDLNNIGSGIDGFINAAQLTPVIVLMGTQESLATKMAKSFPEMVKFAKEFIKYANEHNESISGGVPLSEFVNMPISILSATYNRYHFITKGEDGTFTISKTPQSNADLGTLLTSFATSYITTLSTDEAIKLASEFSNYVGPVLDTKRTVAKDFSLSFVNSAVNLPYFGINNNWLSDISYADDSK